MRDTHLNYPWCQWLAGELLALSGSWNPPVIAVHRDPHFMDGENGGTLPLKTNLAKTLGTSKSFYHLGQWILCLRICPKGQLDTDWKSCWEASMRVTFVILKSGTNLSNKMEPGISMMMHPYEDKELQIVKILWLFLVWIMVLNKWELTI